jgi:prefoldin subunit 5
MLGRSPDEIISSHPHLNLSQVHDALSFYYENRDELDKKAEQDQEFITRLKKKIGQERTGGYQSGKNETMEGSLA